MSQQNALTDDELGGRLPMLTPQELTSSQRKLYDYLQESKISWASNRIFKVRWQTGG
jgi:hypothetical protein